MQYQQNNTDRQSSTAQVRYKFRARRNTMNMRWYGYGHDFGNSEIGGVTVCDGKMLSASIPTAIAKIDTAAMRNLGIDIAARDAHIIGFADEESTWAVGDLALQQTSAAWHGRGDIQRYASKQSLRGLLTVASSLIPDREFGLYVVTGLPAEIYMKNDALRKDIKAALEGRHVFTTDGGSTWRIAHVEVAKVVMEGAGALIAYGSQQEQNRYAAVIDVGGRTTDLYVARAGVPQAEFCRGKPLGVATAAEAIKAAFEEKHEYPLTDLEARDILHAYVSHGSKSYPEITAYGKEINPLAIEKVVKQAVTDVGAEIVSFTASSWRQSERGAVAVSFKPVLCIGGGTFYFYSSLKERIPHISRVSNPVHANAIGYCTLAAQLYNRRPTQSAAS